MSTNSSFQGWSLETASNGFIEPASQAGYAMIDNERPPMDPNTNMFAPDTKASPPTGQLPEDNFPKRLVSFLRAHRSQIVFTVMAVLLMANIGVSAWLFIRVIRPKPVAISVNGSGAIVASPGNTSNSNSPADALRGADTLYIDTTTKSVGIGSALPEGLQIASDITQKARGLANVRLGLQNNNPTILFEDKNAAQWQIAVNGSSLQLGQPGTAYAQVDKNGLTATTDFHVSGNTTLGGASTNTVTLQAATLSMPNNLNIGNNTLFIDAAHGSVAIGANDAAGFKLYVSGNLKSTGTLTTGGAITAAGAITASGTITAGGQIISVAGSALQPSITFVGNANTGIYSPGANITSVSAGGTEVLRVQSGAVSTLNGANLDISGFLRAGDSNPSWKVARYTGTLDGSGTGVVAHGISNASARIIMAMAWYQSGSSAKTLSVDIDGTNIQVDGGIPGVAWRGAIMYTADSAGW